MQCKPFWEQQKINLGKSASGVYLIISDTDSSLLEFPYFSDTEIYSAFIYQNQEIKSENKAELKKIFSAKNWIKIFSDDREGKKINGKQIDVYWIQNTYVFCITN